MSTTKVDCLLAERIFQDKLWGGVFIKLRAMCYHLKVLMKSFLWADRLKDKGTAEDARSLGEQGLHAMQADPELVIDNVFTATVGKIWDSHTCRISDAPAIAFKIE